MRVLIVDDEPGICQRLRRELQKEGCEVEYTTSAIGVLERLKNAEQEGKGYALLLLDLRMPKVDGLSLLKEIREARLDLDVVIITGHGDEDKAIESIRLGAVDYLRKPISLETLHTAVFRVQQKRAAEEKRALEYSVLVVDDEKGLCARIKRELDKEGYHTAVAYDGLEGLDYFSKNRVDVAIVDIGMPRMGGLEMLEKCREITDDFVSIIITGHGDHERAVQALQLGVFNYLRKPISLEELVIAVGKGIEFLHLRRGLAARRRELEIETALKEQYAQNLERMVEERTEELRESEAQYRGIFESASDAFLIFNPGGEIVEANPAACEMYGYSYEELIGLSGKDIVHPDYYHLFEDFKKQVQSSRPFDTESVDVRKDGSTFNVEVHGAPFNYRGKLHLLAVVNDITERVRAEQEISQRAARLTAINRISAAVSTLDLNEILNTITQQMVELFAVEHSGVLMFDEKKEWGYVLAEHPDWGATAERFQVKGYLAAERIIADREPLVIEDTWQDPLMTSVRETMHRLDIRSMLIVPLIVRGEVIGSIGLDAVGRQRRFAAEEVALTQTIANQVSMAIENARLFEAEQRRRQEAETLREAALALTTSLERNQVIERILIQLREVVPYDSASVQLLHDDHLEIIGGHGFPNLEELLGVTFDLTAKNNPNREVIHTRAPFILEDAPAVYSEFRREPHAQAGIRSWLGVPMLIGEQPIGMIALDKREPGFYTPEHARLALAFAAQAAVAIQNARLFEAEQQQTEELEALVEVGRAVSSTLDLNQVLNAIAAHATTISRSDEGGVFELDKAEGVLRITASCNASQEFVRAVNEAGVRVGEGAVGRAVATGKPVQVVDTETEAGYRFQEIAAIDSIRSVLAVPIFKGEELLGGIVLWRRKPCAFSSHNVALLSGLADQAAIAIENARLYQQARRRAERLAAVNRIARAASGTLHLDDLMETVYREVVPLFQADAFFVALYDEETDELDFRIRVDEGTREPPERRPVGSGLTGLIVAKKRPLLIRNFEEERERMPRQVMVWGTMKAPASWLGVPMRIGDRVVGVISVQAYRPHAYGEEEQLLLSTIADQVAVAVENARLFEETRRRLTREVRLNELAHTLGGEMGLATLIPRLLPVVAELTGADAATVAILDPEEQVIVYPYHYNLPASLAAIQVPAESGLAGYTIRARQPVLLDDYKEHPAALQPWVDAGVRSLLAVPLVAGDEVVGMIGLCSLGKVRPFRPEAVAAAQAAARLAAVAVQRVRLFEAEREQRELAEALGEATAVVGSTLDLDQVLDRILEQVERVVAGDAFNIMLVEDDTARMVGWRGYEELGVEDRLATLSFPIAEYRNLMRMAQTGEPFVMLDAAADPDWVTLEGWEWLQSCIAAPIQVGGVTVGFLNVDGTRPGQFSLGDVRRLQTFASHAATAIENARLYQEVQGYTRELEQRVAERTSDLERRTIQLRAAAAVASDAVTAQELDDLLDRVVNLVRDRFGFYHVGIFLVDEEGEYAILKAATGEAGRQMLEYGHKLKVGEVGIVGHVTGSGQPHVALDVGADAAHFKNPLLPETRSELALPLRVGEQTIGALDVQSTQEAAFDEEDVTILQTMTDQLAVAIEKLKRTAQIQAQYARLEAILRSTTDGIIVANREGKILHTNPVTQRWLTQTLSPEEAERLWKTVQGLALQAEERPQTVLELTGLDLELSAAPVVGEGAEEPTVVVAAHDVSHLKALERMKSRFVTSVSHELRTPVTTIKLYAELMQRRPEKWREYLQPLLQEADHQARLVEDILRISRIDAGRLGLKPCPTPLNELTEMTIINHQALAQERRLTLEHQPAEPGPAVLVDPEWMMQALNNLVTNALYYTPEGGRVVVSTGREEAEGRAWATATVADTGMGIPEEELPHIFERFFRGVKPRQMQISGTGLGLAIVKEIVELHGGWVTVESQVGEGTTFTVWLPLAL